jgi:hypothetical protein
MKRAVPVLVAALLCLSGPGHHVVCAAQRDPEVADADPRIVPASRLALPNWRRAGVTPNGGIPPRSTICASLDASTWGNGATDAGAGIQAAIAACSEGQTVLLGPGVFRSVNAIFVDKAITLRGSGPGVTTIEKSNGARRDPDTGYIVDEYEANVVVGRTPYPHFVNATAVNLTANAVKGRTSVTVADAAGLSVGDFVEIAEDQFYTASWQALPKLDGGPNPYQIWKNDRVTWARHKPYRQYVDDFDNPDGLPHPVNSALGWFSRGYGYVYGEVKEIARIQGNTITFTSPFIDTYRTSHTAQLARSDTRFVTGAGVENLTLHRGTNGGLQFAAAARSWAKNIEVVEWLGHGIDVGMSHRIEVTGVHVHYAAWPNPGGGGYAIALQGNSSEILITNSITEEANKNIVANAGGAGSVVAYNYFDDSHIWYDPNWVEVSANASHFAGPHHVLFEGNSAVNFDSDFTHGSSYSHTALRNHFSGFRRSYPGMGNARTVGLGYGSRNFSFVGNVLGKAGAMEGWTFDAGPLVVRSRNIWQLGYDPTLWGQEADPEVLATTLKDGNFDYLTSSVQWDTSAAAIPNSFYLSRKPDFFGNCPWPWVDATGATKLATLPAKARFDAGAPFASVSCGQ